jgi:hypothetical protein
MKFFITVLLLCPVILLAQQAGYKSIHREQSEYYGQFKGKDAIFFDSLNCFSGTSEIISTDTCSLEKLVFGFHPYWMGSSYLNYRWNLISDFCYFSYEVDPATGDPATIHDWLTDPSIDSARAHGVRTHLCATLFAGHYSFFGSQLAKQNLIDNLISLVQQRNADGINIDFEAVPSAVSQDLTGFMISLSEQFHAVMPEGIISIDLPAEDWGNIYDIVSLRDCVDLFFIMGYDYYWNNSSTAGPIAPLYSLTNTYDYSLCRTISEYQAAGLPNEKFILGLPYYARLWKTVSKDIPSATIGSGTAYTYAYIMNNQAGGFSPENLKWEPNSFSSCFIYFQNSNWYQCFIPLARDLKERYDLVNYRGLAGIGIWALGYDDGHDELWGAISSKLTECSELMKSDTLFDCGGPAWNYYNDEDYWLKIIPGFAGKVYLEFRTFSLEAGSDSLWIYDGTDSVQNLLGGYSGSGIPAMASPETGLLNLHFASDESSVASGWQAIWHDGTLGFTDKSTGQFIIRASPNPFNNRVKITIHGSVEGNVLILCKDELGSDIQLNIESVHSYKEGELSLYASFCEVGEYSHGGVYFLSVYIGSCKLGTIKLVRIR